MKDVSLKQSILFSKKKNWRATDNRSSHHSACASRLTALPTGCSQSMAPRHDGEGAAVRRGLLKAVQRSILTYLQSSYGLGICLVGLFLTAIAAFQYGEVSPSNHPRAVSR